MFPWEPASTWEWESSLRMGRKATSRIHLRLEVQYGLCSRLQRQGHSNLPWANMANGRKMWWVKLILKRFLAMLISVSEKRCSWDVPSVTNGSVDCGNLMGQNVDAPAGHVCQVTCIQGYRMNENATNKIICDPNNSTGVQWIRENLYCGKQTFKIMQWQKILSSICIPFRHRSPSSLPFS